MALHNCKTGHGWIEQNYAWPESTKCIEQKSLTDHDLKGTEDMMAAM